MAFLKEKMKSILVMTVLFLLEISAIIRANFLFNDDLARNVEGYAGNAFNSRYIADWISKLSNGNNYITDITPLTQAIACLFLAIAVVIIFSAIGKRNMSFIDYACGTMLMSPFFLENISYKVDSIFMAFSIMAVVIPFLWVRENVKFIVISVIGILAMLMTYQASCGIYPMLVIISAMLMWNDGEKNFKDSLIFIIKAAVTYICSMLFYAIILARKIDEGYVDNSYVTGPGIITKVIGNYKEYYLGVVGDFMKLWNILALLLVILSVITVVSASKRNKVYAFFIVTFSGILLLLIAFGAYPFLEKPIIEPRAMYGFSAFLLLLGVCILHYHGNIGVMRIASSGIIFCLSWCFFAFSFTYGNALYNQMEYVNFRTEEVIEDLADLDCFMKNGEKRVLIQGSVGYAPSIENYPYDYVLIKRLVPVYLAEGTNAWNSYRFFRYYGLNDTKQVYDYEDMTGFELKHESVYHEIYARDYDFIVKLK